MPGAFHRANNTPADGSVVNIEHGQGISRHTVARSLYYNRLCTTEVNDTCIRPASGVLWYIPEKHGAPPAASYTTREHFIVKRPPRIQHTHYTHHNVEQIAQG